MKYEEYIVSEGWRRIKEKARIRANDECEYCGDKAFAIHHVKYPAFIERTTLEYLVVVCRRCHELSHGIRRSGKTRPLGRAIDECMTELQNATY